MPTHWIVALTCCLSLPALAESTHPLLAGYAVQARQQAPQFAGFLPNAARRCISPRCRVTAKP